METTLLLIKMGGEIALVLITVATTAVAAYQRFKAGQYKEGFRLSEETLDGLIIAIEALPDSDGKRQVKAAIKEASEYLGTEGPVLSEKVKKIEKALRDLGWLSTGEKGATIRAGEAARQWKEAQKCAGNGKR